MRIARPLTDKPRQSDQGDGSEARLEGISSKVLTGHPVVGTTVEGRNLSKLPLKRLTCSRMLQAHEAITAPLATVHSVPVVRPARPSVRPAWVLLSGTDSLVLVGAGSLLRNRRQESLSMGTTTTA